MWQSYVSYVAFNTIRMFRSEGDVQRKLIRYGISISKKHSFIHTADRLCGLVVRVLGYRSGGPGSIPGTTIKKVVGRERGPLSLVSTTAELLDRKVAAPV
jgi:hypothetical protein